VEDDRFTTAGAKRAADALIHEFKAFHISGTLGIDQINVVSTEAAKYGVPYMAGGGEERSFAGRMFQNLASYDTHSLQLADYMATDPAYQGKKVGIISSNSEYIIPVAETFARALAAHGSDSIIRTINKPQDETQYISKVILPFKEAGVEVVVPLTDPISTSRIVAECQSQNCTWNYSFSNFAHDSDTALQLMAGKWGDLKVRGLSGACYYQAPEVDQPGRCAQMRTAREQFIAVYGQDRWNQDGSGGAAGYQFTYFWHQAMVDAGADPTRERFTAALHAYDGYANLISGPVTFKASTNTAHGATQMVVLEAQDNERYRMINGGLVDGF
jgi:GNAT superfamily N-acetyltransferase